jgi:iron complex outermembrane receptor protein
MLSGAYGYNDPSFDEDATSPGGAVIFAGGSAVPNAGAPETFSFTGEYTMPIGASQGYVRLDYAWSAEWRRVADQVPTDPFYDPRLKPTEAYGTLNLRVGMQFGNWDVSLFGQNLTNETPRLELSASSYYDPQDWSDVALRPRMLGLTATWRL